MLVFPSFYRKSGSRRATRRTSPRLQSAQTAPSRLCQSTDPGTRCPRSGAYVLSEVMLDSAGVQSRCNLFRRPLMARGNSLRDPMSSSATSLR